MLIELPHFPENSLVSLFVLEPGHVTEDYVSWLNAPESNQYLESRFVSHTVESVRLFVATTLASSDNIFLGINSHLLDRHVGNIKLGSIDRYHRTGEIGILIGDKEAWGKGVATSAISMISEIARAQLNLRKLTAGCYASNMGSQRAFEKAGFLVEGVRSAQFILDGKPEDLVLMGRVFQ
ncbi:MAG: GNAT family N-acetyltransferase [Burkholderiales bacterium PBB3]|nr:MAG: GNAT family N-acetyltransferase [Burkholderiales bacterium PBB3]